MLLHEIGPVGQRFPKGPELLAPGGSRDSIAAAMQQGADAVYAGVGAVNARVRAGNLALEELPEVVAYLHQRYGGRLYVPLNVPMRLETEAEVLATMARCYVEGVDGVIVRDQVLMRLSGLLPGMPIHASTQAGVASVATARRVKELGAVRAILARELDRKAIEQIRREVPGLELEVFLFGAMCFGFSGMCLLGEAVSGRSGNYGGCGQPCRLAYVRPNGESLGRMFSMKDLDLIPHIPELMRMGVAALKIEGRLKSPGYVGCVVHWARRALEQGGLSREEYRVFDREISSLFSRPRGPGYFEGEREWSKLVCPGSSGHVGLEVEEWKVVRDRNGSRLWMVPGVDVGLHDGLLVTLKRPGGDEEEVPYSIPALWSGNDRGLPLARAGRAVEIPIPGGWFVSRVAIHSSDAVGRKYGRSEEPLPEGGVEAKGRSGVRYTRVVLREREMVLTGRVGRVECTLAVPLETMPARGRAFDAEMASGYFGDASFELTGGLYVNPSHVKRARREFLAALDAEVRAEAERLAEALRVEVERCDWHEPESDAELVRRGPAALSWVKGVPGGRVKTEGGTEFRVEPAAQGTLVWWEGGEAGGKEKGKE